MRSINIHCGETNYTISYTNDKEKLLTQFDSFDEWFNERVEWEEDKPKKDYHKKHKQIMQAKSLDDSEESKIKKSIDRIKSKIQSNDKTLYAYGVNKFYDGEKELLRSNGFIRLEKILAKTIYDSTFGIDIKEALETMTFIIDNYLYNPCSNKEIIEQSTTKQVCYQYYCTYAVTLRTLWFASSLLYASTDYFDRLIGAPTTSNMDLVTLRSEPNLVTAILYTLLRFMCCLLFEKILQFTGEKLTNTKWLVLLLKCAPYVFPSQHKVIPGGGKVTSTFAVAATVCVWADLSKTLPLLPADATRTIKYASDLSGIQNDTYGKSLNLIPRYILNIDEEERFKKDDPMLTREIGKDMIRMPQGQDICAVDSTISLSAARLYATNHQNMFVSIHTPKVIDENFLINVDMGTYNLVIENLSQYKSEDLKTLGETLTKDKVDFDQNLHAMLSNEEGFKNLGTRALLDMTLPMILQRNLTKNALKQVMQMPSRCFSMTQGMYSGLVPKMGKDANEALSNTYYLYHARDLIPRVVKSYLIDNDIVRTNTKNFLIKMKTRLADTTMQIKNEMAWYSHHFFTWFAIKFFSKDNVFQGIDSVVVEVLSEPNAIDKVKHLEALMSLDAEMMQDKSRELDFLQETDITASLAYWSIRSVHGMYTNDRLYDYLYKVEPQDMDVNMLKGTRASYERSLWFAIEENLVCKQKNSACTDPVDHSYSLTDDDSNPFRKFSRINIVDFVEKGVQIFGKKEVENMIIKYNQTVKKRRERDQQSLRGRGHVNDIDHYIETTEILLKYINQKNPILSIGP